MENIIKNLIKILAKTHPILEELQLYLRYCITCPKNGR